ncbi:hypothetical protein NC652_005025 [Populus alba x Populus x berolinensis]|nr:hypothetical protein NC652_005015 [Populus alba x Populus x berolinensis]KAJ6953198.1 hypothetical protein NC652_005025 [Populus alba x Populus x berolinensis]
MLPKHTYNKIEKLCRRFIWGHKKGRDKIHLGNWETLCKSKEEGGLGIRSMETMNRASIMKLAWVYYRRIVYGKGKRVAGAGGVIGDGMGTWLMGFARNNGVCSSVTAELWAVYIGLELAWTKRFKKIRRLLDRDWEVLGGTNYTCLEGSKLCS